MLRSIIFDFNGVIADDEPLHLELFQKVLEEEGLVLTEADYYGKNYLGMDDRGCIGAVFKAHGKSISDAELEKLIQRKARYYQEFIRDRMILFPGAVNFVKLASSRYPLAVASGALRQEIVLILKHAGILDCFEVIISAEDVRRGKPDPEGFVKALEGLNRHASRTGQPILPGECLVIEDSPFGIAAAKSAAMKCAALPNSYPPDRLREADLLVQSLEELRLAPLEALFEGPGTQTHNDGPAEPTARVLAYCPDLLFSSKISETGRRLGIKVEIVDRFDHLEKRTSIEDPALILIDLGSNGIDYPESIKRLRKLLPRTSLIAYGSHVDKQLRQDAQAAGCHSVYIRSEFVKTLPELLARFRNHYD